MRIAHSIDRALDRAANHAGVTSAYNRAASTAQAAADSVVARLGLRVPRVLTCAECAHTALLVFVTVVVLAAMAVPNTLFYARFVTDPLGLGGSIAAGAACVLLVVDYIANDELGQRLPCLRRRQHLVLGLLALGWFWIGAGVALDGRVTMAVLSFGMAGFAVSAGIRRAIARQHHLVSAATYGRRAGDDDPC